MGADTLVGTQNVEDGQGALRVRTGRQWGMGKEGKAAGDAGWGDARSRSRTEAPDGEGGYQHRLLGPGIPEEGGESWRSARGGSLLQAMPAVTSNPPAPPSPWRRPPVTSASPSGPDPTPFMGAPLRPSPAPPGSPHALRAGGTQTYSRPSWSRRQGRGAPWVLWSSRPRSAGVCACALAQNSAPRRRRELRALWELWSLYPSPCWFRACALPQNRSPGHPQDRRRRS